MLSGGETTVTIRGKGGGGRNAEFLLASPSPSTACAASPPSPPTPTASTGQGTMPAAYLRRAAAGRMRAAGVDPRPALADNDAYNAFRAVDGLFITGPTGTNVNDFRATLIAP